MGRNGLDDSWQRVWSTQEMVLSLCVSVNFLYFDVNFCWALCAALGGHLVELAMLA